MVIFHSYVKVYQRVYPNLWRLLGKIAIVIFMNNPSCIPPVIFDWVKLLRMLLSILWCIPQFMATFMEQFIFSMFLIIHYPYIPWYTHWYRHHTPLLGKCPLNSNSWYPPLYPIKPYKITIFSPFIYWMVIIHYHRSCQPVINLLTYGHPMIFLYFLGQIAILSIKEGRFLVNQLAWGPLAGVSTSLR